jgi:bleomycin hydrolase
MNQMHFPIRSLRLFFPLVIFLFTIQSTIAQYQFTLQENIACTPIKNQQRTGTCWSFSTVSFLEAELLRMGNDETDLSEMFLVRNIYQDKARNYVLRQGKANFSQGALNHDVFNAFQRGGIVPESIYSGKLSPDAMHDHSEMEAGLKGFLDGVIKQRSLSTRWPVAFNSILDAYLGPAPGTFKYKGKEYTPDSYAKSLGINPDDYVTLTSFMHHPYYSSFILEIPDNYSNGSYINLPLDELQAVVDYALSQGYTVAWDGDVGEKGFSARAGIAVMPEDPNRDDLFDTPGEEIMVTPDARQGAFLSYATTDDHLMHLTGKAVDQNGTTYYLTKNSWGEISDYEGFLYMSEAYFQMKTVGILVHKNAIPAEIQKKLF